MAKKMTAKERLQKRANERLEGQYKGSSASYLQVPAEAQLFKPELGKKQEVQYDLDFITYTVKTDKHNDDVPSGEPWFRFPFFKHSGIGAENKTFVCPRSFGRKCFLCEERSRLFDANATKDETNALRASYRELYIMIDPDDVFQVMEMSYSNFGKVLDRKISRLQLQDPRIGFFEHSKEDGGHTVIATFVEETFNRNTFPVLDEIEFEPREDIDIDPNDVPCLEDMLVIPTEMDLKKAHYDMEEDEVKAFEDNDPDEDDDNEEEQPVRRRRRASVEEEREEQQEDEKEEEEKPRRRRTPRNRKTEDDEDKEEAPRKSRRGVKDKDEAENLSPACPHGHEFGKSILDEEEECDDCDMWEECRAESEKEEEKPRRKNRRK